MHRMLAVLPVTWSLVQATGLPGCVACTAEAVLRRPNPLQPNQGCTVLYATDGELMLGGNNEDYLNPLTKVWFIPGEAGSFGRVCFGFDDYFPQGGMNDHGLFFDGLALETEMAVSMEGKEYGGNLVDTAMAECATVECAVGLFERYYMVEVWSWQLLFGDATGESAILEADAVIRQRGGYQVATNFPQSTTSPRESGCWRYRTAVEGLEGMESLSVEAVRDVLDATHQSGLAQTLYSNVYDLNDKVVYLYYFHNFDEVVVLDLEEELAEGYHAHDLPSLFPPNQAAEDWAGPRLRRRQDLIASRLAADLDPGVLQAYAGAYELPEGWGAQDQVLTVIAQEGSLLLRLPDYRQYELFPESPTEFFDVAFQGYEFGIAGRARFGLDEEGRVESLEVSAGPETVSAGPEAVRLDRVGPESFVPGVVTPEPTATATQRPTATATAKPAATLTATTAATTAPPVRAEELALAAPTATVVEPAPTSGEPDEGAGFPWAWLVVLLVVVGAGVGWAVVRRGSA